MKNYIGLNIKYLCDKNNFNQDDFGLLFGLKKSVVGTYIREISNPKIEVIQKICFHFELSIDDFVNTDLSTIQPYSTKGGKLQGSQADHINEIPAAPYPVSPKYVAILEKALEDKEKIIKALESQLNVEDKSKTA